MFHFPRFVFCVSLLSLTLAATVVQADILFADTNAADLGIQRYSEANGAYLGPLGSTTGLFVGARYLTYGPDAKLYVGTNGDQVWRYNGTTYEVFVSSGSGGLQNPFGLTFGADGNLYVAGLNSGVVHSYQGPGGALPGSPIGTGIFAAAAGSSDGIAFRGGYLYVSSLFGHLVQRFDATAGAYVDDFVTAGSGGLSYPHGIAFGPDGDLYVAGAANDAILRYDGATGASKGTFATISSPFALAFKGNYLYASSQVTNKVHRFNATTGAQDMGWSAGPVLALGARGFTFTASLVGHVELQGYVGRPGIGTSLTPVLIELIPNPTGTARTERVYLDASNNYKIDGVAAGTYNVAFTASGFLRRVVPNKVIATSETTCDASLMNGDVDGNNYIGTADFSVLSTNFDKSGD